MLSNRAIRALPAAASPCINGAGVPWGKLMPVSMLIALPPIITLVATRPQLRWMLGCFVTAIVPSQVAGGAFCGS